MAKNAKQRRVSRKIRKLVDEGRSQDQAVAIALDMERRGKLGKTKKHGTPPADVQAFDPRPQPAKGKPAPPTSFDPHRGKTNIPKAASAPQPTGGNPPKGNPAKKHGLKHFSNPKTVKGGPTGGKPSNKRPNKLPSDVRENFNVKP